MSSFGKYWLIIMVMLTGPAKLLGLYLENANVKHFKAILKRYTFSIF